MNSNWLYRTHYSREDEMDRTLADKLLSFLPIILVVLVLVPVSVLMWLHVYDALLKRGFI
jgi:hypothetical protein